APKRRQLGFIVAATLIAMGGATFLWSGGEGIGGSYEGFLFLIGGLFVPLLGVVIADSFVVRRGTYAAEEFFEGARPWRWSAFASWIPGAALYFMIVIFALPVGATLPSFALAAGLQVVFSRLESSLTRPASAASGGDP
ncbi:MAG TPA: cytosine permease, partial [Thermoplasmata archaeon]|nr:cytosine permease [Thermoplasmata archaeon]